MRESHVLTGGEVDWFTQVYYWYITLRNMEQTIGTKCKVAKSTYGQISHHNPRGTRR